MLVNSKLVDADKGIFEILGTLLVRISSPYWTHSSDIDEDDCSGVIFTFVDADVDESRAIATIEIVDVTLDGTEPDISILAEDEVETVDAKMQTLMTAALAAKGMRIVKWMSSKLNKTKPLTGLVTPFIVEDSGKQRQYIDLRFTVGSTKFVARGTFDVERSKELAAPIFGILQNIRIRQT